MPARDQFHDIVIRCLVKVGWTILREHYAVVVADNNDVIRRLFIDIAAQSPTAQIVLIEVKSLESSPTRQFLVYRTALDSLGNATPLYVAISDKDYERIIWQPLAQNVIRDMLAAPIPFVVFNPAEEEIVEWIPPL
ncbi:MAG: element excision factor XisH family protein [Chloroflexota bacterium]|nr:element excision factor XisH family protein [Chloroflexota bacterium]